MRSWSDCCRSALGPQCHFLQLHAQQFDLQLLGLLELLVDTTLVFFSASPLLIALQP
jgi:hypothetical protein